MAQYLLSGIEYFNKNTGEFVHFNTNTFPDLPSNNTWTVLEDENGIYISACKTRMSIISLKSKSIKNSDIIPKIGTAYPVTELIAYTKIIRITFG